MANIALLCKPDSDEIISKIICSESRCKGDPKNSVKIYHTNELRSLRWVYLHDSNWICQDCSDGIMSNFLLYGNEAQAPGVLPEKPQIMPHISDEQKLFEMVLDDVARLKELQKEYVNLVNSINVNLSELIKGKSANKIVYNGNLYDIKEIDFSQSCYVPTVEHSIRVIS